MDTRGRPGPAMRRPDVRPAVGSHGDAPHARGRCRGLRLALPGPRSGVACALCSGRPREPVQQTAAWLPFPRTARAALGLLSGGVGCVSLPVRPFLCCLLVALRYSCALSLNVLIYSQKCGFM